MARPNGSKNRKSVILAFPSSDARSYFTRTELPADIEYRVYTQPSVLKPGINWYYLAFSIPQTNPEVKV